MPSNTWTDDTEYKIWMGGGGGGATSRRPKHFITNGEGLKEETVQKETD
jgi:hypothetical protein